MDLPTPTLLLIGSVSCDREGVACMWGVVLAHNFICPMEGVSYLSVAPVSPAYRKGVSCCPPPKSLDIHCE